MAITYLKKSPKTSSTDDNKTTGIVQDLLKNIQQLLHQEGYTIKGVQNLLRNKTQNQAGKGSSNLSTSKKTSTLTNQQIVEIKSIVEEFDSIKQILDDQS